MRKNFLFDIPETSLTQAEILKLGLAVELMEGLTQPPEDGRTEQLIASLLSIPWDCNGPTHDAIKLLGICQRYFSAESPTGSVSLHHALSHGLICRIK